MTKELESLAIPIQAEQLPDFLGSLFIQWGISVSSTLSRTKKGAARITFTTSRGMAEIDTGTLLTQIQRGGADILLKVIARCFPGSNGDVDTRDLLTRGDYVASCLTEIAPESRGGNASLNRLVGAAPGAIPVLYGSTSGINPAEVFETIVCAQAARARGWPAYTIFDSTGHENARAIRMLEASSQAIPGAMRAELKDFTLSLGQTWEDRRVQATRRLVGVASELPVHFITAESTLAGLEREFSLAKLLLLTHLAGGQPLLFAGGWKEVRPKVVNHIPITDLARSVAEFALSEKVEVAGFTYYARDAVLGADVSGATILPCKLTTHANIYKILEAYGSLWSQRADGGAILCPITRHRIQTREQAASGADPCDVIVVAFLAERFPEAYAQLVTDFAQSCKVLTPTEAIAAGTRDKRFIIEDYFPI